MTRIKIRHAIGATHSTLFKANLLLTGVNLLETTQKKHAHGSHERESNTSVPKQTGFYRFLIACYLKPASALELGEK